MDKELEILKNLSKYLQLKIESGEHKIFYNDLMHDEKTIDCINAIETLVQAVENSIPKSVVEKEIIELKNMKVGGEVFTTSVNFAIKILQELLQEKKEK